MINNDLTTHEIATLIGDVMKGIEALLPYVKCATMKERVVNLMVGDREDVSKFWTGTGLNYTPGRESVEISLWYALIAVNGFLTYKSPEYIGKLRWSKMALKKTLEKQISSTPLTK